MNRFRLFLITGLYAMTTVISVVQEKPEIQEFLHFAITEQDFFAFNAFDVRQAIETEFKKAGVGVGVSDVPDTIVQIRTANQEHETSFNALSFWAQRYPSIKALEQLRAIELRLTRLVEDIKAGRK